jgi:hypothetical protein
MYLIGIDIGMDFNYMARIKTKIRFAETLMARKIVSIIKNLMCRFGVFHLKFLDFLVYQTISHSYT